MRITETRTLYEPGWERIADDIVHPDGPDRPLERGVLVRNVHTGIYRLATLGGGFRSVPQRWAREMAERRDA